MIMMAPYTSTTSKGKKPYKSWLKDGVNGGPSSMDVLVNWLSKKANYAKWKGDDCERIPKKSLLESIIDQMREVGIYHRLAKDVASKISTLQSNYRLAREWKEVDGKKLLETGASEEGIHEELLKRFPYWDALNEVFNSNRSSAWPMSISSIMHASEEEDLFHVKQEEYGFDEDDDSLTSPVKRRRRLSDSTLHPTTRSSVDNTSDSASTTHSTQSLPVTNVQYHQPPPPQQHHHHQQQQHHHHQQQQQQQQHHHQPTIIRPLPRVLPSPIIHPTSTSSTTSPLTNTLPVPSHQQQTQSSFGRDHILAESLLQVTREKEAGRMKRSQDMLQFLREKRMERDQLLIEKELTKRVKAKAELVKNLMEAGFDKTAIAEQLNML
ncbi:hypothetical protein INT46_003842 [Mucor plumbeus]|uniref:Uncharacterized protein n=1 Tax=Mucor plumbeus TaxID=97098 RepID=A0A8H7UTN0_9FUNG|nr:hypothetical protein INT46_003842 [Mucor plumbeus]